MVREGGRKAGPGISSKSSAAGGGADGAGVEGAGDSAGWSKMRAVGGSVGWWWCSWVTSSSSSSVGSSTAETPAPSCGAAVVVAMVGGRCSQRERGAGTWEA